ncbi:MAG TPA: hypothetical protein VM121_06450 [Acidimicrobiales bacterium]|nr:hypothetical protein [Acidimicrobiales bacterium]
MRTFTPQHMNAQKLSRVRRAAVRLALVTAVLGVMALVSGVTPAMAKPSPGRTVVVYPTGIHPGDSEAVQAAVAAGGIVRLEAADRAGVPTAFNFGDPQTGAVVRLTKDVTILGAEGSHRTRIAGGLFPFFGVERTHTRIEGITFERPGVSAMIFIRSTGAEIVDNHITGVVGVPLVFPLEATEGRGVKFLGNRDPKGAITGDVLIAGNRFDNMNADLSEAIVFDRVAADVRVVHNEVADVSTGGVLAIVPGGDVEISDNTIVPGRGTNPDFHYGNGIAVVGNAGGAHRITGNTIRCENPLADAIQLVGQTEFGLGAINAPIVTGNDLSTATTDFGGISLFGDVNDALVANNRLRGSGMYALGVVPAWGGETAARNTFRGNNLSEFDAGLAHTAIFSHAVDTVAIGNAGTVFNEGEGSVITGEGPVRGAVARVRSDADATAIHREVRGGYTPR